MAWYRCGGGSGGENMVQTVLQAYAANTSQDSTVPRTSWDAHEETAEYFVYNSSTHKWTVQKNFKATIALVVRNYKASSSAPVQAAFVDNTEVLRVTAESNANGSFGGGSVVLNLTQGQEVYFGKPVNAGYEAPYCYVFDGDAQITEVGAFDIDNNYGGKTLFFALYKGWQV